MNAHRTSRSTRLPYSRISAHKPSSFPPGEPNSARRAQIGRLQMWPTSRERLTGLQAHLAGEGRGLGGCSACLGASPSGAAFAAVYGAKPGLGRVHADFPPIWACGAQLGCGEEKVLTAP